MVVPTAACSARESRRDDSPAYRGSDGRLRVARARRRGARAARRLDDRSDLRRAFDWSIPFADNVDAQIFFVARLPRTLAGALVGAALATAGVVFQGLLRNPLATPFTLGVSSGAALGAMLAITFDWTLGVAGISAVSAAGFVGAACAVAIVYSLARAHRRGLSTDVLLLAGVTLNAFFSALILCVQ